MTVTATDEKQCTEILQHRIEWSVFSDNAPGEIDETSIEHIETMIRRGYREGELCVPAEDGKTTYRGWWRIVPCQC